MIGSSWAFSWASIQLLLELFFKLLLEPLQGLLLELLLVFKKKSFSMVSS